MLILPISNGLLPRPYGGRVKGVFLLGQAQGMVRELGRGEDILLCPVNKNTGLYPVGVAARAVDIWTEKTAALVPLAVVVLEGRSHARWNTVKDVNGFLRSDDTEYVDLKKMSSDYPVISGAGWVAAGGYTEIRDKSNIHITIYGNAAETGEKVAVAADLGGLLAPEQAHTVEHSIIRALNTYCLCSVKTLVEAMREETSELKKSVEVGLKYALPEVLGVTQSGYCGNPMTNLAQIYLAREFSDSLNAGKSLTESLDRARKTTMSQLTNDIGLTDKPALRALQGLKKGMAHDDTMLKREIYKKVIARFNFDPWEG
jgi:hypothetical protein